MTSEVLEKDKLEQRDVTKLALENIFMMISVKDLKVIKKIMDHEMENINNLFKTMDEHSNNQQVVKEVKLPTTTEMQFKAPQLQILVLDEKTEGGLVPIFWMNLTDGWYESKQRAPIVSGQSKGFAKMNF